MLRPMNRSVVKLVLALWIVGATASWVGPAIAADAGQFLDLKRQEIEVSTRVVLLKSLVSRHQKRAEEAQTAGQSEKAQWESALAKEFTEQGNQAAAQLESVTRERLALEEKDQKLKTGPALNSEESAYLGKIDGLLLTVEQELAAAVEAGKALTSQLQTNAQPEHIADLSAQISENRLQARVLERERASLELERLRFRALRSR